MCLSRHLLPGRGASAISPSCRKQYTFSSSRAVGLPFAKPSAPQSYDRPGKDKAAEGPWHH
jgi:hypothetical protein